MFIIPWMLLLSFCYMYMYKLFNRLISTCICISIISTFVFAFIIGTCPVSWGCRIHWLLSCRGVRPLQWVSWYDTKQSDGEVPVMLELGGIGSTSLLPSHSRPLWPHVVTPDSILSMGQIVLNCILILNELLEIELFWHLDCVLILNWIVWNETVFVCWTELFEIELFLTLKQYLG